MAMKGTRVACIELGGGMGPMCKGFKYRQLLT